MTETATAQPADRPTTPRRLSRAERADLERRWKRLILIGTLGFFVGLTGLVAGLDQASRAETTISASDDAPQLVTRVRFRTRTS
jgi:hypothetical protein